MDTTPIYELRRHLRSAAIVGTNLLSEDFRLRRAYEIFKPLAAASPVFAKVGQLTEQLLSPDCKKPQGTLLDTISLIDAILCTLGTVEAEGEVKPDTIINSDKNASSVVVEVPYSTLKALIEALTISGSGHYGYVCDERQNHPEHFRDYRVKYAMVQALGASYVELANYMERWLIEDKDKTILPFLYRDFDPKGKKEMMRRLKVIDAIAGADANDFYVKMLDEAQKDIRQELIFALRHEQKNASLLSDLVKTEKGKNKQMAKSVLAVMEDESAFAYFRERMDKKPFDAIEHLVMTSAKWSSGLVAEALDRAMQELLKLTDEDIENIYGGGKKRTNDMAVVRMFGRILDKNALENDPKYQHVVENMKLFNYCVLSLYKKGGEDICRCYKKMLVHKEELNHLKRIGLMGYNEFDYHFYEPIPMVFYGLSELTFEKGIATVLYLNLMMKQESGLKALAIELYDKYRNTYYLPAAVTVKLIDGGDCAAWLEEQIADKKEYYVKTIEEVLDYVWWDSNRNSYVFHIALRVGSCEVPVRIRSGEDLIEWMMCHASDKMDAILSNWLPFNNNELCKCLGEWFYNRAFTTINSRQYLVYMKKCGWTNGKGLGVRYIKFRANSAVSFKKDEEWLKNYTINQFQADVYRYLKNLPGGTQTSIEEAEAVCEGIKSGSISINQEYINVALVEKWISEWKGL